MLFVPANVFRSVLFVLCIVDAALDFFSPSFDPLKALNDPGNSLLHRRNVSILHLNTITTPKDRLSSSDSTIFIVVLVLTPHISTALKCAALQLAFLYYN